MAEPLYQRGGHFQIKDPPKSHSNTFHHRLKEEILFDFNLCGKQRDDGTVILRNLDKESESGVEDFLCEFLKCRLYFVNAGNHLMVLVRGMRG